MWLKAIILTRFAGRKIVLEQQVKHLLSFSRRCEKYVTLLRVNPVGLTASHSVYGGRQRLRQAHIHLSVAPLISPLPENQLILQLG